MSTQKAKQIQRFSQIPKAGQYDALLSETPLHREAYDFKVRTLVGLGGLVTIPPEPRKRVRLHYAKALEVFARRFLEACRRKDGGFFRALADVIECQNNRNWSNRERYIFAQCSIAENMGERLPSAGQLLRGWKIHCGLLPERKRDLLLLWQAVFGNKPMPKTPSAIERALRPHLGRAKEKAADVQIIQIVREAKNLGFNLPRQAKGSCLPAGFSWAP
jgi:hypothetical protein